MRGFMSDHPREEQAHLLNYLRAGCIVAYPMGADLTDRFNPPKRANPTIRGKAVGGLTPMTDGTWFWYAGLIYFIENYNVAIPSEFVTHARQNHWQIDHATVEQHAYQLEY
jgi:hypothetical protein